jgi:hypothetical protein
MLVRRDAGTCPALPLLNRAAIHPRRLKSIFANNTVCLKRMIPHGVRRIRPYEINSLKTILQFTMIVLIHNFKAKCLIVTDRS